MSEQPKHHKKERTDFAFGISRSEFFTSMLAGIGSGLATAAKTVRDKFKLDTEKSTAFKVHFFGDGKLVDETGNVLQGPRRLGRAERLDAIDLQQMISEGKTIDDYHKAIWAEKKLIAQEFDEIAWLRRGVRKNMVLGTIDKFKLLGEESRRALNFTGISGAVIGTALTLGFFNGVATRDKIERIEDAVAPDNSQSR